MNRVMGMSVNGAVFLGVGIEPHLCAVHSQVSVHLHVRFSGDGMMR